MTIRVFRSHKGDINKGIPGQPGRPQSEDRPGSSGKIFVGQGRHIDRHDYSAELADQPMASRSTCSTTWSTDGDVGIVFAVPGAGPVFRHGQARRVPAGPGRARSTGISLKGYFGIWLQMVLVIRLRR